MPGRDELLAGARVAHLATADREGRPHVVPICFVWHAAAIYTPLDLKPKRARDPRRLRRVRNVLENPRAMVVVDHYDEDWTRLAYVLVEGAAALLEEGAERGAAEAALAAKYPQYAALPLAGRPILRIKAERVVAWP